MVLLILHADRVLPKLCLRCCLQEVGFDLRLDVLDVLSLVGMLVLRAQRNQVVVDAALLVYFIAFAQSQAVLFVVMHCGRASQAAVGLHQPILILPLLKFLHIDVAAGPAGLLLVQLIERLRRLGVVVLALKHIVLEAQTLLELLIDTQN